MVDEKPRIVEKTRSAVSGWLSLILLLAALALTLFCS